MSYDLCNIFSYVYRANTAVDQIASDIANSLSPTHVYSKVTSNGALPSLPIAAKPTAHLNLTLRNSNSFDGKLSVVQASP